MKVVGIKFKTAGKVYYFSPLEETFIVGDGVIVETVRGVEYGKVVIPSLEIEESELKSELKPIIRKADDNDRAIYDANLAKRGEAMEVAKEKIRKFNLQMKLIDCEFTFDNTKVIFYFTSEQRVDFRELVKELAAHFRIRIELRQVGIRDETKTLGGLGACGKPCCCSYHLPEFVKVSIKMAKTQNLSLNPQKISGLCGRLMCCLEYENEHYAQTAKLMPKLGSKVETPEGKGEVVSNNMLKMLVRVKLDTNDGSIIFKEYPMKDINASEKMSETLDDEN